MPTAARLVAAICLGILGYLVSEMIKPRMPEGTDFGYFNMVNAGLGILCGWFVMGSRAGRGLSAAVTNGLTGVAALVFWGLFVQGCYEMFRLAMRNRYDGPFEAVLAIFEKSVEFGAVLLAVNIISTLIVGAVISGLATENAWRRWR